jgi:hypothetical protein
MAAEDLSAAAHTQAHSHWRELVHQVKDIPCQPWNQTNNAPPWTH